MQQVLILALAAVMVLALGAVLAPLPSNFMRDAKQFESFELYNDVAATVKDTTLAPEWLRFIDGKQIDWSGTFGGAATPIPYNGEGATAKFYLRPDNARYFFTCAMTPAVFQHLNALHLKLLKTRVRVLGKLRSSDIGPDPRVPIVQCHVFQIL